LAFARKKQTRWLAAIPRGELLDASLAGQKQYAEAEPLLLEGYQGIVARKDHIGVRTGVI
jgi:hypothetical protein